MKENLLANNECSDLEKTISQKPEIKEDRGLFRRIGDWYFAPKSFEKDGRLYESLGVRHFQKLYFATGGKAVSYFSEMDSLPKYSSINHLRSLENKTKVYERIHHFFNLLMCPLIAESLHNQYHLATITVSFLNIGINIYPIMLQRYNRSRIHKLIERKEAREQNQTERIEK